LKRNYGGKLAGIIPDEYGFLRALPETRALTALLGEIAAAIRARKRADAGLTFDDLVTQARTPPVEHPAVPRPYAARFRAVLVDEFQDTDRVQAEVVRALAAAGVTPFIVGDEKQSIYRFRGADVAVFHDVAAEMTHQLPLGTNFRSQPPILQFV